MHLDSNLEKRLYRLEQWLGVFIKSPGAFYFSLYCQYVLSRPKIAAIAPGITSLFDRIPRRKEKEFFVKSSLFPGIKVSSRRSFT